MDLAIFANHRVRIKENEDRDKYLDLARKLNNLSLELVRSEQSPKTW